MNRGLDVNDYSYLFGAIQVRENISGRFLLNELAFVRSTPRIEALITN